MADELLTGNLLQDGIVYHAADINAAINNAALLPNAIGNKPFVTPVDADKLLVLHSGTLGQAFVSALKTNALTNVATTGNADLRQGVSFSGRITATLSGFQNNYNPSGFENATLLILGGTFTLTGMQAGGVGTLKIIYNNTATTLTLALEHASSTATNRLDWGATPATIGLTQGQTATFIYNGSRWSLLCTNRNP